MKKWIVLSVMFVSMGCLSAAALADTRPATDLETHYTRLLDSELAHCRAKTRYRDSRLTAMRQTATHAAHKARFLEDHRAGLLAEMREAGLGTNPTKGEHFLNTRFGEYQRALAIHYQAYLDTKIANCKAKLRHGQSKFDTLQRKAAESALRAQFMETHRAELLDGLREGQLGTRTAALDHFVNARFYDYVHPELLAFLNGR